jgi:hypothetical protein
VIVEVALDPTRVGLRLSCPVTTVPPASIGYGYWPPTVAGGLGLEALPSLGAGVGVGVEEGVAEGDGEG